MLAHYDDPLSIGLHCPVVAATEGFLRLIKLPGAVEFFGDSQPMFLPSGEQLAGQVPTEAVPVYCTIFLQEVCDFPLGMAWPKLRRFLILEHSEPQKWLFQLLDHFIHLQPQLTGCLSAVKKTLESFGIASLPFLTIHHWGYPSLVNAEFPTTLLDTRAFSPMLEMVHGFIWHLTSNTVMTTNFEGSTKGLLYLPGMRRDCCHC
jgi:hypothetical protein